VVIRRQENGVGVVFVNGFGVWALWVRDSPKGLWRVRLSLDDIDAIGIHEYQRVRLKLPRQGSSQTRIRHHPRLRSAINGLRLLPFTPAASHCALLDPGMQPESRPRPRRRTS
jgi:hypothetical protein